MSLEKHLRSQGYDLIDGSVRNHKPLQLWVKKFNDEIELYHHHIDHAFTSDVTLNEITNNALDVNSTKKNDYSFNIGLTILEKLFQSLGIHNLDLSTKIKSGKKVSISYDNSITTDYPIGEIGNYLSVADFKHYNPILLKNLNRDNVFVISGIVYAKNLIIEIETDFDLSTELVTSLNSAAEGQLDFTQKNQSSLRMVSNGTGFFPIAVKANKIIFHKGTFKNLELVTDKRDVF